MPASWAQGGSVADLSLVILDQQTVQIILTLGHWRSAVGDLAWRLLAAADRRLDTLVAVDLTHVLQRDALHSSRGEWSEAELTIPITFTEAREQRSWISIAYISMRDLQARP